DGAAIERVRLERKKETGADYVAALRRLGFDPGEGQVSRQTALAAAQFVSRQRADLQGRFCGDVGEPAPPAPLASPVVATAPGAPAATSPAAAPANPLPGVLLPPQERASPVQLSSGS